MTRQHDLAGTCRLNGLELCLTCGKLRGTIVVLRNRQGRTTDFQQQCNCQIDAATRQLDRDRCHKHRLDFPQMFDLCHCCGHKLICSGSRLSWLFCQDCRLAIEQLNDLCNQCVIPVGRHTFMAARWGRKSFSRQPERLSGTPQDDPAEYQLALKRQLRRNMRIWSERIDRVTRFGMQITATHIGEIASTHTFAVNKHGMPLRAYLRSCTRTQRSQLRCFQALGLEFLVPYQIIQRVAVTSPLTSTDAKPGNADPRPTVHVVTWQSDSSHRHYGLACHDDLQQWQQLEQAVRGSANWKQFRQACPARHHQPVCRAFRRAGVPAPHDQQSFLMDDLPTDVSDDWRPRPAQAMLEWMPAFLVGEFGTVIENGFESASVQFSEQELRNVARILETRYGYRVVRNAGGPLQLPLGR